MAFNRVDDDSIIEMGEAVGGVLPKPINDPAADSGVKLDGGGAMVLHPHLAGDVVLQELGFPTLYGHGLRNGHRGQHGYQPSGHIVSSTVRHHGQPLSRSAAGHLGAAAQSWKVG